MAPGPAVNTLLVVRDILQGHGEEAKANVLPLTPESLQEAFEGSYTNTGSAVKQLITKSGQEGDTEYFISCQM